MDPVPQTNQCIVKIMFLMYTHSPPPPPPPPHHHHTHSLRLLLLLRLPWVNNVHQLQMMQQQNAFLQQLRQQQQQHHMIQGGGALSSPQSSVSMGSNVITSRTTANPIQNSIATAGGLVMTASGQGFQHSFQVAGSESPLRSSSSGGNRMRAPISYIPTGNPQFQEVRSMPHLTAIGRNELSQSTNKSMLQGKPSLNSGTSTPRPHFPSQQVT